MTGSCIAQELDTAPYTYPKINNVKVLDYRNTEPALQALFEAQNKKKERENATLPKDEYLNSIVNELKIRTRATKFQIFEIGKLLCEAKKIVGHGNFKPWIEVNFEQSYRTARNAMLVYEVCMGRPEMVEFFSSNCLHILCSQSFPENLREALFVNVSGPVDVSKKDLIEIGMKYKKGEITFEDEPVQNLLKQRRMIDIKVRYDLEIKTLVGLVESRLRRIEKFSKEKKLADPLINKDDTYETEMDLADEITGKIQKFISEMNVIAKNMKSEIVA